MLPRATQIHEAVRRALERNQTSIETDCALESVHFEIAMGRRSGMPVKVRFGTTRSLVEVDLVKIKESA